MHSFDIFDTLITRAIAEPRGVFVIMEEKLKEKKYDSISDHLKNNFSTIRENAEELTHYNICKNGIEDKTLFEIYRTLQLTCGMSDEERDLLIDLEIEIELLISLPIKKQIDRLKNLVSNGEKVILISDMYLPENTIRRLLIKHDSIFLEIPLFVSSEIRLCKSSGNMFVHIKEKLGITYENWNHLGDNDFSDVEIPSSFGIGCEKVNTKVLLNIEKEALNHYSNKKDFQYIIGAGANIKMLKENHEDNLSYTFGVTLGGPILYGYVEWIIDESLRKGLERLYFIARDGYVLKMIADKIIEKKKSKIQTFYIYGSRKAWRIPAVGVNKISALELINGSYLYRAEKFEDIGELLGIEAEKICDLINVSYHKEDILTKTDITLIEKLLLSAIDELTVLIEKENSGKRQEVISYLFQEVDFHDSKFAFVEMAGSGATQTCLKSILEEYYPNKIKTFFFKLDNTSYSENNDFMVYFPSLLYLNVIIEMLARAPHYQTIGYEKNNDKIIPVFDITNEVDKLKEHGYESYIKGVVDFSEYWLNNYIGLFNSPQNLQLVSAYINYITRTPDEDVLNYFTTMPNAITGREKDVPEFAPELTDEQILEYCEKGKVSEKKYKGSAIEYSILRSRDKLEEYFHKNTDLFIEEKNGRINKYVEAIPIKHLNGAIVLFGAGEVGNKVFEVMLEKGVSPILWIDSNAVNKENRLMKISGIEELSGSVYDYVIICVISPVAAGQIEDILISNGVEKRKIIWINNNDI